MENETQNQQVNQAPVISPYTPPPILPAPKSKLPLVLGGLLLLLLVGGGSYYIGSRNSLSQPNKEQVADKTTSTSIPTTINTPTAIVTNPAITAMTNWKTYTSTTEKASFKYPPNWVSTKPAIETNLPGVDETAVQSPSGAIKVSWVSALNGFGGGCNDKLSLGQDGGCPLFTLVDKIPISTAPGLYVVSGTITRDGISYQPFLAVQDSTGLLTTKRMMSYDMFTGKNNGSLPENRGQNTNALFSTADAYGRGPSLSQAEANAWFNKTEVQEAKQILLSLTY